MKNLFLLMLAVCLLFCGCGKKQSNEDDLSKILKRGKIIVGVRDDAAPFGFRDKHGNLIGYDIDLAKKIASGILGSESKIDFVPVTASNRILKLINGDVDILVATMSVTNRRQQVVDFARPYYVAGQAIMVKTTSKAQGLKDFEGKRLITVYGSTGESNLQTNVPEVELYGCKTYPEAYAALKAGKAQGIVADDTILMSYALNDKSVKILPKRYSQEPYAVAVRKDSARLLNSVDYIIENLQSTGKLTKMQEQWKIK